VKRSEVGLIVVGVGLAVAAIVRDDRRISFVAIVVLAAALLLRMIGRRQSR
jgi:hypothetical protein